MTRNFNSSHSAEDDIEKGLLINERKNFDGSSLFKDARFSNQQLHSRSIRRLWNRLSRFQRFIICVFLFFVILCIIILLPWANSSLKNDFQSDSDNIVQKENLIHDKHLQQSQKHTSSPYDKSSNKESVPKLKMEKVDFDGINSVVLKKIIGATSGSNEEKRNAVVNAFVHAWSGYRNYAWGHDHLKPITKSYQNWFGLGLTIVDSLDTMFIMGLKEEFNEAKEWIKNKLNFSLNKDVNFFETTIRVMGGLLSAFHLSKDNIFLDKAIDIANRLLPGFHSSSGIPYSDVNLQNGHAHPPSWGPDSTVSEVSTVQLEFRDLSRITKDSKYEEGAFKVSEHLHQLQKKNGLVPMFINAENGQFRATSTITIGARADSYYEYLLKQWIQTGKKIDWLKNDYIEAIDGIMKHLVKQSYPNKLTFVGELLSGRSFSPKMDHLVCYLPGTLALGYHNGMPSSHLRLAFDLIETCYNMYAKTATFLSPEIAYFNLHPSGTNDIIIKSNDAHNLLRPETVESLWYLFHLTHNETYRDWGWQIFQAFEKYSKVDGGYTSIGDVRNPLVTKPRDLMESFFLAETLKYLFLLFSDNQELYSLDKYIFNSEAHFLPILNS